MSPKSPFSNLSPTRQDFENFHIDNAAAMPPQTRSGASFNEDVSYISKDGSEHTYSLNFEPDEPFISGVEGNAVISINVRNSPNDTGEADSPVYQVSLLESVNIDVLRDDGESSYVECDCSHDSAEERCKVSADLLDRGRMSGRPAPPQRTLHMAKNGSQSWVERRRGGRMKVPTVSAAIQAIGIPAFEDDIRGRPGGVDAVATELRILIAGDQNDESFDNWRAIYHEFASAVAEAAVTDEAFRARLLNDQFGVLNSNVSARLRLERRYRAVDRLFHAYDAFLLYPDDAEPGTRANQFDMATCVRQLFMYDDDVSNKVIEARSHNLKSQAVDTLLHVIWGVVKRSQGDNSLYSYIVESRNHNGKFFGLEALGSLAGGELDVEQIGKAKDIVRKLYDLTRQSSSGPAYDYYRHMSRLVRLWEH